MLLRKIILWGGTLLLIPWVVLVAFGITFSFTTHESWLLWTFVIINFLATVPAVVISWRAPRWGSFWILGNTLGSIFIAGLMINGRSWDMKHSSPQYLQRDTFVAGTLLFGPQLLFAISLLVTLGMNNRDGKL